MSTTFDTNASASVSTPAATALASAKPLWAAVGVLSVAVLGMGGMLIHGQNAPAVAAPVAVVSQAATPAVSAPMDMPTPVVDPVAKAAENPATVAPKPVKVIAAKPRPMPKPHEVTVAPAHQNMPQTAPQVVQSGNVYSSEPAAMQTAPVVAQSQPRQVCINCGTVESVTPIEAAGASNGLGAVAGGVLGAVLGHQVGNGNGRTAATILGALGGGFAGNAVEKNVKKTTHYEVRVRMEDGHMRTVEQASPVSAGERVVIENGVLRAAPQSSGSNHTVIGAQSQGKVYTSD